MVIIASLFPLVKSFFEKNGFFFEKSGTGGAGKGKKGDERAGRVRGVDIFHRIPKN